MTRASKHRLRTLSRVDALIAPILAAARIPGAGVAIVLEGETVFSRGYGYRELEARADMTTETSYPVASTTKAINATLIGMLIDEGKLAWDTPVQNYLPRFRLGDAVTSSQVTIRDLLVMRTGLPRHDWLWIDNPMSRHELIERLRYLDLSAGFREKFQYNNLTATAAGHVAETVTGRRWEDLVLEKILEPLNMMNTGFELPVAAAVTLSYHERRSRELIVTTRLAGEVTAPSGGSMHSTVRDMAQWVAFNLTGGMVSGRRLIRPEILSEIQSPQIPARTDSSCPTPNASYAMGWFVDVYRGHTRVSHGGYLHDVNSSVMLFPEENLGVVSFINFGSPRVCRSLSELVLDTLCGSVPTQAVEDKLRLYEKSMDDNAARLEGMRRAPNTSPSHPLNEYAGQYVHPAYGSLKILRQADSLIFQRGTLLLPLTHWHYDAWAFAESDFFEIHDPHCFDPGSRVLFETDAEGRIVALSIPLEPAVAPIRFTRQ